MDEKRLFLLDAYALIYRAYYALIRAPRVTSKGLNTSAIFGFCNTLDEILRKENPTHIAVCFDPPGGSTFRHEFYPGYKAQRDKQPEDITLSIPYIKEILAAYRIPVVEVEGFEADDVIGTLSRIAEREGFTTYMMTPDKDYGQLVTDRVLMYRPSLRGEGFEIRGPQQVCERYGISTPRQVIDLLALEGDVSDNVPGCPGVGEKTAVKLISEFGSVENLLARADELKGALRAKVTDNAAQIEMSKYLVTIKTDVPLPEGVNPEAFVRRSEDVDALLDVYRRLEFRSFITRITGNTSVATSAPEIAQPVQGSLFDEPQNTDTGLFSTAAAVSTLATTEHTYTQLTTAADIARFVGKASSQPAVGVQIDADGSEAMTATIRGIAIAVSPSEAAYMPLTPEFTAEVSPLFSSDGTTIVCPDVKRAYLLMKRLGVEWTAPYSDTAVTHYLLDPESKHQLQMLTMRYLDYEMISPAASPDSTAICEQAAIALRLHPVLLPLIDQQGQRPLLDDIELPLVKVLAEMEWTGVRINTAELANLSMAYSRRLNDMEDRAYQLAGGRFNISSPMQVGEVLFGKLAIDPKAKRTKRGSYSTTEEVLEKFRGEYEIVDLILRIRALRKLLTTYINALPTLVNPATGKIHTSYNQTVTATGRISSTAPNLQNIPVRSEDGREIRRAFIPDTGDILLSADYSQIELRLMAHMSGDTDMIEAFRSGADIHRSTAAKIYHLPLEEVTDDLRRNAKTANFGIIYGISAFGLSERLGISRAESKELINGYFRSYPGVRRYMDSSIENARDRGYVTTVMGRKRYLPDINSRNAVVRGYAERNAINAPLQGSAADIIKLAMVTTFREMESRHMRSRMIMQVHDELVFNVVPDELDALTELVVRNMESAFSGSVPMEVSVGTGQNWLEAH